GAFDGWLLLPFLGWLVLYVSALAYFVPRLGKVAQAQADARSLMTGRVTDAYANIATVKLFSHARREAGFVRGAMQECMVTALGRGQVDDRQPAAALLRRQGRPGADRRAGCRPGHPGFAARAGRHGDAGHIAAAPLGARQHPLRAARRRRCADDRRGTPGGGA